VVFREEWVGVAHANSAVTEVGERHADWGKLGAN
jgi:hypothetical protein